MAGLVRVGVLDREAGEITELHCLADQRIGARNERLAGNDGGGHGEREQGKAGRSIGSEGEEGIGDVAALGDEVGALAKVIEHEARQHDGIPSEVDRPAPEMTHVGVESLDAGDREDN